MSNRIAGPQYERIVDYLRRGYSYRRVANYAEVNRETVATIARTIGIRRTSAHRSPSLPPETSPHVVYDDEVILWKNRQQVLLEHAEALHKQIVKAISDDGWKNGARLLRDCRRLLKERTKRQKHNAKNAVVEGD